MIFSSGKCFEVLSVDSTASWLVGKDGALFNFNAADTDATFDGTNALSYSLDYSPYTSWYPTVDQYRNGALINESIEVYMYNDNQYSPSVGDSYGVLKSGLYSPGKFQTGDYLCIYSGETASLIADIS